MYLNVIYFALTLMHSNAEILLLPGFRMFLFLLVANQALSKHWAFEMSLSIAKSLSAWHLQFSFLFFFLNFLYLFLLYIYFKVLDLIKSLAACSHLLENPWANVPCPPWPILETCMFLWIEVSAPSMQCEFRLKVNLHFEKCYPSSI